MKFLLDVCTSSNSLRKLLADLGHDVRLAGEVDPRASDEEMLNLALQEGRALITEDKDFGELVFVPTPPPLYYSVCRDARRRSSGCHEGVA